MCSKIAAEGAIEGTSFSMHAHTKQAVNVQIPLFFLIFFSSCERILCTPYCDLITLLHSIAIYEDTLRSFTLVCY